MPLIEATNPRLLRCETKTVPLTAIDSHNRDRPLFISAFLSGNTPTNIAVKMTLKRIETNPKEIRDRAVKSCITQWFFGDWYMSVEICNGNCEVGNVHLIDSFFCRESQIESRKTLECEKKQFADGSLPIVAINQEFSFLIAVRIFPKLIRAFRRPRIRKGIQGKKADRPVSKPEVKTSCSPAGIRF